MRRPPTLELQVPAEPAPLWVTRGVQLVAVATLSHWALAWAFVQWELSVPAGALAVAALISSFACLAFMVLRCNPATGTWLRFDGEQWHWSGLQDETPRGSGMLKVAARLGPWWLLHARAHAGPGRSQWIWMRPDAVCGMPAWSGAPEAGVHAADGTRLRTLLNWT